MHAINDQAQTRLRRIVDDIGDASWSELQRRSNALCDSLLQELRAKGHNESPSITLDRKAGTMLVPGLGTVIDVSDGVMSKLFKGLQSFKKSCTSKLEVCIVYASKRVRAEIESKKQTFERAMRGALEQVLQESLERFDTTIAHRIDSETKTLDRERSRLKRLQELQAVVQSHDARFKELAKKAAEVARAMHAKPKTA